MSAVSCEVSLHISSPSKVLYGQGVEDYSSFAINGKTDKMLDELMKPLNFDTLKKLEADRNALFTALREQQLLLLIVVENTT